MNDLELRARLHLLAARRLSLRHGAAQRFRGYLETDAGAKAWSSCRSLMGLSAMLGIGMPTGPSENDEALLRFIDAWAKSNASLDDVEPLPALVRGAASLPSGVAHPREPAPPGNLQAAAVPDLRMKRRALVLKHAHAWPTIDADLRDGSRNGLSGAARNQSGRDWIESKALEWAQSKGKLIPEQAPLPRQLHRLAR